MVLIYLSAGIILRQIECLSEGDSMPFDGIVMKAVSKELRHCLLGGRIEKVFQPDREDILIHVHNQGKKYKLIISANAASSRIHLTQSAVENPKCPPNFCILLRKYFSGGRIKDINQSGLERILEISVESTNDIGDLSTKILVVEIMGKHSNIILLNQNRKIIDSIKHIDFSISRIREVLPGRDYIYPLSHNKTNPLDIGLGDIIALFNPVKDVRELEKLLVNNYIGISPYISREFIQYIGQLSFESGQTDIQSNIETAANAFYNLMVKIKAECFQPYIIFNDFHEPIDYHSVLLREIKDIKLFNSVSHAVDEFFFERQKTNKFLQRKSELAKLVQNHLAKCVKKISIQQDKIDQVSDMDTLKLFGELITSNLYRINHGDDEITVNNYYSNAYEEKTIKLDPNISPSQNAQRFFKKYSKAKNTHEAASSILKTLRKEEDYLQSILYQLELCENEEDLADIKDELIAEGMISSTVRMKKADKPSAALQFISSDRFVIFVGKNNRQNDKLTLKQSFNSDIWLHTRNIPGSHVVIRTDKKDVPENTLFEAAEIAAYFSKARYSSNVPVDYTFVRNVKKPSGAKPGFVIYENFKTLFVTPDKEKVDSLKKIEGNN